MRNKYLSMNFNKLIYTNNSQLINHAQILIYQFDNKKIIVINDNHKYYYTDINIDKHTYKVYFILKQFKNTNYYFRFRYSDRELNSTINDIINNPFIQIFEYNNNMLIYLDVYICANHITDVHYYFSRTKQQELYQYYKIKLESQIRSLVLLHQL